MDDLISRQAAIDAIKGLPTWWADGGGYYGGAQPPMEALLEPNDVISAIDNLPSAQPERKTGRWLRTEAYPHRIYCSSCFVTFIRNDEFLNLNDIPHGFCPNCGAKMDVEHEKEEK